MENNTIKYIIGIDPPKGLAVWDKMSKSFCMVSTLDFWGIIEVLNKFNSISKNCNINIKVYCEAPHLNKPLFFRKNLDNEKKRNRAAQNVGMNKMTSKLIIEYCNINNIEIIECRPTKKSLTKLTHDEFFKLTGYTKRTSEHGRDAAMLVWGM